MSLLVRESILEAMEREAIERRLIVVPLLDGEQVGAGTVDLRLGTEFLEQNWRASELLDPFDQRPLAGGTRYGAPDSSTFVPLGDGIVLHPDQFLLGASLEFIQLPADIGGQVLSRSSWGRLGLLVATAVVVQPGFQGCLTLELVNTGNAPIMLRPGLRVAQLQLWSSPIATEHPYSRKGKYRMPLGPQGNKLAWEGPERDRLRTIGDKMHGRRRDAAP